MELTVDQALQQGVAAHKEGKVQEAEKLYRAILSSQPQHPDANHNLGVLAVGFGKVAEALPFFKVALDANPQQVQFWLSYIDALMRVGQLDNARRVLQQGKAAGLKGDKLMNWTHNLLMRSVCPYRQIPRVLVRNRLMVWLLYTPVVI